MGEHNFVMGKHAGAWVSLTASGVSTPLEWEKSDACRLSVDEARTGVRQLMGRLLMKQDWCS